MGTRLDQIEARLQALIERSVMIFARGDAQHRLAHQLVAAVQENIYTGPDGHMIAPDQYAIYLHPDSLDYWQQHSSLLESIGRSLEEAAREYDVQFTSQPVLHLYPDPQMPLEGLRVETEKRKEESGQTAAFTAVPTTPAPNAIPRNAFLIVEGNRVFPLDRPVINIGRRPDNHLVIADPRVSRSHAQIRAIRGQYILFDLNSTGGTVVNGMRVRQCALKPGDVISLSGVPLIYGEDSANDEETEQLDYTQTLHKPPSEPPEIIE